MITLLVCDDDIQFLNHFLQYLNKEIKSSKKQYEIFSFEHSADAMSFLSDKAVDVAFLDIDMTEFSGFDIAREISEKRPESKIIFISNYDNLVFDSFYYSPMWFIKKNDLSDLSEILRRIESIFIDDVIEIKQNNKTFSLKSSQIHYIESQRNYIILHYEQNEERIRATLKSLRSILAPFHFLQPHHSFLVNSRYISWINKKSNEIILISGKKIPISKNFKKDVIDRFSKYLRIGEL